MNYNYYELLELESNATMEDIEAAYIKLSEQFATGANHNLNHMKYKRISHAYEVLSDPIKRSCYDYELNYKHKKILQEPLSTPKKTLNPTTPKKISLSQPKANTDTKPNYNNSSKSPRSKNIHFALKITKLEIFFLLFIGAVVFNVLPANYSFILKSTILILLLVVGTVFISIRNGQNEKRTRKNRSYSSSSICPVCSSKLIKRKSKYGQFYGCSRYPKCTYTKNIG